MFTSSRRSTLSARRNCLHAEPRWAEATAAQAAALPQNAAAAAGAAQGHAEAAARAGQITVRLRVPRLFVAHDVKLPLTYH